MFFNLREAAEHGVNVGTNWASYPQSASASVSDMAFERPRPWSETDERRYECGYVTGMFDRLGS